MAALLPGDPSHHAVVENGLCSYSHDKHEELDRTGATWYLRGKDIKENSPSRKDGIDVKKEASFQKSYCTFLQELGMSLKVPQITIATAMIFCHRFFLRQSHAKNDRRTIATVCMFLAGKVEETPRPLKDVILISYVIIHKKNPTASQKIRQKDVFEKQKELILLGERVVLATLNFDLNVDHPYKPLVEAIKKFKVAPGPLAQVAWNFVNDGFLKVKLPSDGDTVWWQEFHVTPKKLEEVGNQMLELYEQNQAASASKGNEAERGGGAGSPHRVSSVEKSMASGPTADVRSSIHLDDPNGYSPIDAIKKINKDKVKAALEKHRKSRADVVRKVDAMDFDDIIEREIESGVEVALSARRSTRRGGRDCLLRCLRNLRVLRVVDNNTRKRKLPSFETPVECDSRMRKAASPEYSKQKRREHMHKFSHRMA
ncbi:Cyclin-T1-3 [Acorus calamus]|uniref:Cyclin-T1-3 n=1 Tax=Acorus calamus TaxID=4465 RepID=A0AAV9DZM5_ACOCL|nr:Cyclin-T1-3 [Acorus calamus]